MVEGISVTGEGKKKKTVINISYKGKKIHRKGEKTNLPERRQKI